MKNFYNKKDKYLQNDFDVEGEEILNSSMKEMGARTKSNKKKKKINQDYDEGIQFVDLASLDSEALFKTNSRTPENAEYMSTVLRGFIFIFMLLISLFAIFLIFKTPYYSYYNQDEPIILGENKSMLNSDPFAIVPSEPKTQVELEQDIIIESVEPEQSNVKLPTAVVSKPKTKLAEQDEMLRRDLENSRATKNKQDTEITKLLKNSESVAVAPKTFPKAPAKPAQAVKSEPAVQTPAKAIVNDMPADVPADSVANASSANAPADAPAGVPVDAPAKESKESGLFKYPAMGDKKMVTDGSKVFANQNGASEVGNAPVVNSQIPPATPAVVEQAKPQVQPVPSQTPATEEKLQENKPNNVAEQSVWLVNIYSTSKRDEVSERLLRLKNQYKTALSGTTFYLVENTTEKGTNYRISVAEQQSGIAHPSFADANQAKSFCASLKSQGLDCFVSSVSKSALPRYILK